MGGKPRSNPGKPYRVQYEDDGFDELVIGAPCWFHLERMDHRQWFLWVGDRRFWVLVPARGPVRVTEEKP